MTNNKFAIINLCLVEINAKTRQLPSPYPRPLTETLKPWAHLYVIRHITDDFSRGFETKKQDVV